MRGRKVGWGLAEVKDCPVQKVELGAKPRERDSTNEQLECDGRLLSLGQPSGGEEKEQEQSARETE